MKKPISQRVLTKAKFRFSTEFYRVIHMPQVTENDARGVIALFENVNWETPRALTVADILNANLNKDCKAFWASTGRTYIDWAKEDLHPHYHIGKYRIAYNMWLRLAQNRFRLRAIPA
jgi:hypothetical protein